MATIAITPYWVYPTTDVHLVVDGPTFKPRLFHERAINARAWQEVTSLPGHTFTPADTSVVTVNSAGRFFPGAVGTTTVRIERAATPGVTTLQGIVRVSVHNGIERIWAGNNRVIVRRGASDYILSVYAKFTDGTIADVTGHPYLRYIADPAFVSIDADGRVTGNGATAETGVVIQVTGLTDPVPPTLIDVTVITPSDEPTGTLVLIHGSAQDAKRRNILLVTEGFSEAELPAFREKVIEELSRRLFRSASHSPFPILRDSLNLWLAMMPSAERGITIGPSIEIIRSAAEPFDPPVGTLSLPTSLFPLQARHSFFGLLLGSRLGDLQARVWSNGVAGDLAQWLLQARTGRSVTTDYRRLPDLQTDPVVSFRAALDRCFDRLGSDGARWKTGQRDAGLVCFIVNEDLHGGSGLPDETTVAATVGHGNFLLDSLSNPPLHPGRVFWDHEPRLTSVNPNVEALASKISHEIGHSPVLKLGDEYEGGGQSPGIIERFRVNLNKNLQNHLTLGPVGDPPPINTDFIKWNLHRITKAGLMKATPVVDAQDRIFVPLESGTKNEWTLQEEVFLWNPQSLGRTQHPLEFAGFDPHTFEAFLLPTGGRTAASYILAAWAEGSILYSPARDDSGNIRTLIEAEALADIKANGAFGQLTLAQCAGSVAAPADNPAGDPNGKRSPRIRPKNISLWLPDYKIIGLYESGGLFRCRVYRPSGYCRMRHHYDYIKGDSVDFCFVCKYSIVDAINPGKHPELNKEYPE